jgi:hypothetical protein
VEIALLVEHRQTTKRHDAECATEAFLGHQKMSWISDPVLRGIDCNSMPNAANTSIKMCIRVAGSPASNFEIVA